MSAEFINAAQHLADILSGENDALARLDFDSAIAFVPEKDAALADLARQSKLAAVTPMVMELMQVVNTLAAQNQSLLERALAVQTRIVRIVARASVPPPVVTRYDGYGGQLPSGRAVALAVSTRA